MADDRGRTSGGWSLFGFQIQKVNQKAEEKQLEQEKSFTLPTSEDGAVVLQTGAYYGTYVDLEGVVRNEIELITRYREMSMQAEIEAAIDDIVNEAIVVADSVSVEVNTDNLNAPPAVKKAIETEFSNILRMLNFGNMGHDLFKRWYVDGRMFWHVVINEKAPKDGIKELRYIDPRRIRKIREVQKTKDPRTGTDVIKSIQEYYLYNDRGVIGAHSNMGSRIASDAIININSGLMDSRRAMVLSYLHKAIKPLNMLRMVEDATVIYRTSRAPERRVFYIDVGNMPPQKSEQYIKDVMTKYRNKIVYDSTTGEIKDDRKHMSMLEDFWLPRREGGKGTQIDTLKGGENLGKMEDVEYFRKKLYQSLSVPLSRLDPTEGGTGQSNGGPVGLGRVAEVTRDELKFTRFVQRLRNKFSIMFDDILRVQLVLKGICTTDEWEEFKEDIWYDYLKDNNISELKEAEVLQNRLTILAMMEPFIGKYWSLEYVRREILKQDDDEIKELDAQIAAEQEANLPGAFPVVQGPTGPVPSNLLPDVIMAMAQKSDGEGGEGEDEGEYSTADQKFDKLRMEHHKRLNNIKGITRKVLHEQINKKSN